MSETTRMNVKEMQGETVEDPAVARLCFRRPIPEVAGCPITEERGRGASAWASGEGRSADKNGRYARDKGLG